LATRRKVFLFGLVLLIVIGGFLGTKLISASDRKPLFTGKENHKISHREAEKLIWNFQQELPEGAVVGGFFGKNAVMSMLTQSGVVGVRAYFAKEDNGAPTLVLFAVDESGHEMVVEGTSPLGSWFPCPPFCWKDDTVTIPTR